MTVLENLWHGNINPQETFTENDPEYKKLISLVCRNEDELTSTLTDKQKETLVKFNEATTELNVILEEKAFTYGFSFAVKIMFECFFESDKMLNG